MRITVLALDDVFDLGLSAIVDAFQTANELIGLATFSLAPFDVRIAGVRARVHTSHGFRVPLHPHPHRRPDCIIVPAIGFKMPEELERALQRRDVTDASQLLRESSPHTTTMAAACIGTFVMAESGLLDEHNATTTWWLAPLFRQRYPRVRLDESNMIVRSGPMVTAGAALSHIDLALWLIRRSSPQLAALTARYLIVDSRPSQSAYALRDHLVHNDPVVQRFETWARGHLTNGFSLEEAARVAGASKRTLARHLERVLGKSPLAYFQSLRVERAVHLLRTTDDSIDEIATHVGYADANTLRLLLRRELRMGLKEIRRPVS